MFQKTVEISSEDHSSPHLEDVIQFSLTSSIYFNLLENIKQQLKESIELQNYIIEKEEECMKTCNSEEFTKRPRLVHQKTFDISTLEQIRILTSSRMTPSEKFRTSNSTWEEVIKNCLGIRKILLISEKLSNSSESVASSEFWICEIVRLASELESFEKSVLFGVLLENILTSSETSSEFLLNLILNFLENDVFTNFVFNQFRKICVQKQIDDYRRNVKLLLEVFKKLEEKTSLQDRFILCIVSQTVRGLKREILTLNHLKTLVECVQDHPVSPNFWFNQLSSIWLQLSIDLKSLAFRAIFEIFNWKIEILLENSSDFLNWMILLMNDDDFSIEYIFTYFDRRIVQIGDNNEFEEQFTTLQTIARILRQLPEKCLLCREKFSKTIVFLGIQLVKHPKLKNVQLESIRKEIKYCDLVLCPSDGLILSKIMSDK